MDGSLLVILSVLLIFIVKVEWNIYLKAGRPGSDSIIPIYNVYVRSKIAFGNLNYFKVYIIYTLISIVLTLAGLDNSKLMQIILFAVSYIFSAVGNVKLSRAFGKRGKFNIGVALLSYLFLAILAFGDAEYEGPQ